jgi:hypothetical protein
VISTGRNGPIATQDANGFPSVVQANDFVGSTRFCTIRRGSKSLPEDGEGHIDVIDNLSV